MLQLQFWPKLEEELIIKKVRIFGAKEKFIGIFKGHLRY